MTDRMKNLDQLVISNLVDGLVVFDLEWRLLRWNSLLEKISGIPATQVIGRRMTEIFPHLVGSEEERIYRLVISGVSVVTPYQQLDPNDSSKGYYQATYAPLRDEKGEMVGGYVIVRDVSEQVLKNPEIKAAIDSRKAEERFRDLVDNISEMVWAFDVQTRSLYVNRFGREMMGVDLAQMPNVDWSKLYYPGDLEKFLETWQRCLIGQKSFALELRMRRASDGQYRWMLVRGSPIVNERGQLREFVGISTEIHEQKVATSRSIHLQAISEALAMALTPVQVAEVIAKESIVAMGAKSALVTSLSDDKQRLRVVAVEGRGGRTSTIWAPILMSSSGPLVDAVNERRAILIESLSDAQKLYPTFADLMQTHGEAAYGAVPKIVGDEVTGSLGLGFDSPRVFTPEEERFMLTLATLCAQAYERARVYEREQTARAAAELANSAKTRFLAKVSHELRTPLTAIIGFADLLRRPREFKVALNYVEGIIRNGRSLSNIVDDLLDLAKIESQQIRLVYSSLSTLELVADVANSAKQLIGVKPVRLDLNVKPRVPEFIVTDAQRLRQVLLNVVSNAVKYTAEGSVAVEVGLTSDGQNLEFTVSDTGCGIDDEDLKNLFIPFAKKASTPKGIRSEGSGLGLAIVKPLSMALGGDVQMIWTEVGKGTRFLITVPIDGRPETERNGALLVGPSEASGTGSSSTTDQLRDKKVLLVEDQEELLALLADIFTEGGALVTCAENGSVALEEAKRDVFDLVIMDLQMPVLDGYQTANAMRKRGYKGPMLALSAHALTEHKKSALEAGFDWHMAKPFDRLQILKLAIELIDKSTQSLRASV